MGHRETLSNRRNILPAIESTVLVMIGHVSMVFSAFQCVRRRIALFSLLKKNERIWFDFNDGNFQLSRNDEN